MGGGELRAGVVHGELSQAFPGYVGPLVQLQDREAVRSAQKLIVKSSSGTWQANVPSSVPRLMMAARSWKAGF